MTHSYHPHGPAVLYDDCAECEERGKDPHRSITQMDTERFKRAWARAGELQLHGLSDGQHAELPTLRALIGVQLQFEQLGIAKIGELPTTRPKPPAFVLEVNTTNSWFEEGPLSGNLAHILEMLAIQLAHNGVDDDDATIMDGNGNTVGRYRYTT